MKKYQFTKNIYDSHSRWTSCLTRLVKHNFYVTEINLELFLRKNRRGKTRKQVTHRGLKDDWGYFDISLVENETVLSFWLKNVREKRTGQAKRT